MVGGILSAWAVCATADTGHRDFLGLALDTTALPENYSIVGQIVDSFNNQQLPISGALVTFAGAITAVTDIDGNFEIRNIPRAVYAPGNYQLLVSHDGYKPVQPTTRIPPVSTVSISLESNTVILLHGIRGDGDAWRTPWSPGISFASTLSSGGAYKVVIPEFEYSCAPLATNANILRRELAALHASGIQSYSIVGHSAGGLVALHYLSGNAQCSDVAAKHVLKLITLGTPHHGSPLAIFALNLTRQIHKPIFRELVRNCFCDGDYRIAYELVPGNATLNLLNYGQTEVASERTPCGSHGNETALGIGLDRVYCIVGTSPEANATKLIDEAILTRIYSCPNNDGVVPTSSAFIHGLPRDNYWEDSELSMDGRERCHTEHFLGDNRFTVNACIADAVNQILQGTPPAHSKAKSLQEEIIPHQFLPTISRDYSPNESLVDSSLVLGMSEAMFVCTWGSDSLNYYLETPSGQIITSESAQTNPDITWIADNSGAMYLVKLPEHGIWKHRVECPAGIAPGSVQITASFDSQLQLALDVTAEVDPSGAFECVAEFRRSGSTLNAARVMVTVVRPDGASEEVHLADDGLSGDSVAGDGAYWGFVPALGQEGVFGFSVRAVEDSTQSLSEAREMQQIGVARSYSSIEILGTDLVVSDHNPTYGSLVGIASTYRNTGFAAADSVLLMIENARYGISLADTVVSLAPGQSFTLHASWMAAATDTTRFRAVATVLRGNSDDDFANNAALSWAFVSYPDIVTAVPNELGPDPRSPSETAVEPQIGISPNPLNASTELRFVLTTASTVQLSIYDLAGRLVRCLANGRLEAGEHVVRWDGTSRAGSPVSSGIYLCRLEVAGKVQVAKLAVIK